MMPNPAYIALHTARPHADDQTIHEVAYSHYARVPAGEFAFDGGVLVNTTTVYFPECGKSKTTITHFSFGVQRKGRGHVIFSGKLNQILVLIQGMIPTFAAGSLRIEVEVFP